MNVLQFILMIVFTIAGAYHVREKASLPFKYNAETLVIQEFSDGAATRLFSGAKLLEINSFPLNGGDQLEFFLDGKNIGDTVNLTFEHNQKIKTASFILAPFYSNLYLILQLLSGLSCLFIGWLVYQKKKQVKEARIFYYMMIFAATIILLTWGNYTIEPYGIGLAVRILFSAAYVFAPATFLYFTLTFPVEITRLRLKIFRVSALIAVIIFIWMAVTFLLAVQSQSIRAVENYLFAFNSARFFSVSCIISSVCIFAYSYKNLTEESDRRKLRWLLLGFIMGPFTFASLWVIPQAILGYGLIAEEFILILMLSAPVTFGISVTKYHIMDIDSFINRGTVYSVIFFALFILYISGIAITTALVGSLTAVPTIWASIVISIIVAIVFQPLKNAAQKLVDKIFFRKTYEFREVTKVFSETIDAEFFPEKIFEHFIAELNANMPLEKSAIILIDKKTGNRIEKKVGRNLPASDELINSVSSFIKQNHILHCGIENWIEPGANVSIISNEIDIDNSIVLWSIIPFENELCMIIFLGKKKSKLKFGYEDIDLIQTMLMLVKSAAEQFYMKQKLMKDLDEIEKLKELNRLKSYFVSLVSHEMQTPLTSIKLFSELMQKNYSGADRNRRFLQLMEGECDRLSALINNILNYAKIENGMIEFHKNKVDLKRIVEDSILKMQYQFEMNSFAHKVEYTPEPLFVYADADAVTEIFLNLISNSIKYSGERKSIIISLSRSPEDAVVIYEDSGVGIADNELQRIFSPYKRAAGDAGIKARGIGLGLAIVKNIIDNHEGKISVESAKGVGTKFTITLPFAS